MRRLLALSFLLFACTPPSEKEPQWTSLFDGKSLDGWQVKICNYPLGEDPMRTFRAEDGVLRVCYDEYQDFEGRFGHIFHEVPWSHYRIRLEYRFLGAQVPGGAGWAYRNSGIMVHGQSAESMGVDQEFPVSIEVQLLGGDGEHPRATANLCTPGTNVEMGGELVTRHCTDSNSETFHGDQWVSVEVEVLGGEVIRHFVNGVQVMEYQRPQLDPNDADAKGMIRDGVLLLERGTVSLQAESHPVEFRGIEVLKIGE